MSVLLKIAILNGCIFVHLYYVNNKKLVLVEMYDNAFFFFVNYRVKNVVSYVFLTEKKS